MGTYCLLRSNSSVIIAKHRKYGKYFFEKIFQPTKNTPDRVLFCLEYAFCKILFYLFLSGQAGAFDQSCGAVWISVSYTHQSILICKAKLVAQITVISEVYFEIVPIICPGNFINFTRPV